MKVARLKKLFLKNSIDYALMHTGQHYDSKMSDIFFSDLGMDPPDMFLGATGESQIEMIADILVKSQEVFAREKPDLVIVPGDVNSTVSCALSANRLGIPVAHLEAGLRSFDRTMPEEINRILTDKLSSLHFVTEESGVENLSNEGTDMKSVFFVGNTMIDALTMVQESLDSVSVRRNYGIESNYILVTFHRPVNVDSPENLREVVRGVNLLGKHSSVVFPMHPRTRRALERHGLIETFGHSIKVLPPLGYVEFLSLVVDAIAVYTDSGGIQEETAFLGVPCFTIRPNTERPATIKAGTNKLMPLDAFEIQASLLALMNEDRRQWQIPPLWDGCSSERIVDVCTQKLLSLG